MTLQIGSLGSRASLAKLGRRVLMLMGPEECRIAREISVWSIARLATNSGISVGALTNYENGHTTLTPQNLRKIRQAFAFAGIDFYQRGRIEVWTQTRTVFHQDDRGNVSVERVSDGTSLLYLLEIPRPPEHTPYECMIARAILDWSVKRLAAEAGVSGSAIHNYETGRATLGRKSIASLTAAFAKSGLTITYGCFQHRVTNHLDVVISLHGQVRVRRSEVAPNTPRLYVVNEVRELAFYLQRSVSVKKLRAEIKGAYIRIFHRHESSPQISLSKWMLTRHELEQDRVARLESEEGVFKEFGVRDFFREDEDPAVIDRHLYYVRVDPGFRRRDNLLAANTKFIVKVIAEFPATANIFPRDFCSCGTTLRVLRDCQQVIGGYLIITDLSAVRVWTNSNFSDDEFARQHLSCEEDIDRFLETL